MDLDKIVTENINNFLIQENWKTDLKRGYQQGKENVGGISGGIGGAIGTLMSRPFRKNKWFINKQKEQIYNSKKFKNAQQRRAQNRQQQAQQGQQLMHKIQQRHIMATNPNFAIFTPEEFNRVAHLTRRGQNGNIWCGIDSTRYRQYVMEIWEAIKESAVDTMQENGHYYYFLQKNNQALTQKMGNMMINQNIQQNVHNVINYFTNPQYKQIPRSLTQRQQNQQQQNP